MQIQTLLCNLSCSLTAAPATFELRLQEDTPEEHLASTAAHGLFFLLAGLALAVHSQPVGVGPLSVAPPELYCQQVLPPYQQEIQHNSSCRHHCAQTCISNSLK